MLAWTGFNATRLMKWLDSAGAIRITSSWATTLTVARRWRRLGQHPSMTEARNSFYFRKILKICKSSNMSSAARLATHLPSSRIASSLQCSTSYSCTQTTLRFSAKRTWIWSLNFSKWLDLSRAWISQGLRGCVAFSLIKKTKGYFCILCVTTLCSQTWRRLIVKHGNFSGAAGKSMMPLNHATSRVKKLMLPNLSQSSFTNSRTLTKQLSSSYKVDYVSKRCFFFTSKIEENAKCGPTYTEC